MKGQSTMMIGVIALTMLTSYAFAYDFDEYVCTKPTKDPAMLPTQYGTVIDAGIMGDDVGYMIDTGDDSLVDVFLIDRGGDSYTFEEIAQYPEGKSAVRVISMRDSRCA